MGNLAKGTAGQASYGGGITFDKQFLRTADRKDFRGALIHELTHTQDKNYLGDKAETRADLARFMLNPKETADWKPSADVRAMARDRGDMAEYRGGKVGEGNRRREGQGNKESKKVPGAGGKTPGAAALPAMTPAQTAAYYDQLSGLYQTYQNQLMDLRQQRVGLRTAFKTQRTDIRGEMIGGLADAQNAGIERGTLGGSAQAQGEIGIRAEAEQARSAAKNEMLQGLAYNRIAQTQAATDYFAGGAALRAQQLAQQQEQLATALQNNTMISDSESRRGGTNGGNGSGGGAGAQEKRHLRDPNNTPPPNFKGSVKDWRQLAPDEKFRYMITSTPTYVSGGRKVAQ